MTDFEHSLIPSRPTEQPVLNGDIVVLPPEYEGYMNFYAVLRQGTIRVIDLAEALLRDDQEIPDPALDPKGHRQQAMTRYGIYGPIPEMSATLGWYHIPRLRYIVNREPDKYSPGFKPPALKHFIGINDPIIAVLHCTTILIDQADSREPLRPIFTEFPARYLDKIDISGQTAGDRFNWDALREAERVISQFRWNPLRKVLSWQEGLGSTIIDGSIQTPLLRAED